MPLWYRLFTILSQPFLYLLLPSSKCLTIQSFTQGYPPRAFVPTHQFLFQEQPGIRHHMSPHGSWTSKWQIAPFCLERRMTNLAPKMQLYWSKQLPLVARQEVLSTPHTLPTAAEAWFCKQSFLESTYITVKDSRGRRGEGNRKQSGSGSLSFIEHSWA